MKNLIACILYLFCTYAVANEPQVNMVVQRVIPCVDVTQAEPMPAICTYFTVDGIKFSTAHSRDSERRLLSIIYYAVDREPQIVTKEQMKDIVTKNQLGEAI